MQASRKSLREQLARRLSRGHLAPFKDVDLDILVNLRCTNLSMLSVAYAEKLSNAGLPTALIDVLQDAGLMGKHHSPTPDRN